MKHKLTPEKRVGKTANLIIFLGILYTGLSISAISGRIIFLAGGYGVKSLIIGLMIVGLGYGIRYGNATCLYAATGFFTIVAAYFIYKFLSNGMIYWMIRFALSLLSLTSLTMSIPAMVRLKVIGASPDRSSRYKDLFLSRLRRCFKV